MGAFANVLTPEQKTQFDKLRQERKQRFEERRQRGPEGDPDQL
jgi:Spy/CpxP family protein refolding chaperone